MNFVDISYFHNRTNRAEGLLEAHRPNLSYFDHLPEDWQRTLIKFADAKGHLSKPGFEYHYFKGSSAKLWLPLAADRFIARLKPDVVMVHGLIFPQQVLLLKTFLPKRSKIIIQHHAERPAPGRMQKLQKLASKYVDAYLFSTKDLAEPWIRQGIVEKEKVFEVMEGSSVMQKMDKPVARTYLGLGDHPVFLWVGRLDKNKNPLLVLSAFDKHVKAEPGAKLYMVYHEYEPALLRLMTDIVNSSSFLKDAVVLKGKLDRTELAYWYNAADYYISGSFSEGSGYALIEAMSCGCIPIVSDIPSFGKITRDGAVGFLFPAG
ncbi:MAG: glycosyltransferase family 4 protein, partial [Chitinophagaceae bacterium]